MDPDPGGLKRAQMKKKNPAKRQTGIKSIKINVIGIKMFIPVVTLFSLKFYIIWLQNFCF
jgi:hypothetical protein